jgi:DNA mismatch endonuclease (patch repair protein)
MDTLSKATRSWVMSRVKSRGSGVERVVTEALRKNSRTRFLVHAGNLPGRPDIAFPKLKLAIFVNGCFWHWHGCARCRMPASNRIYWQAKIARNAKRDRQTARKLNAQGWHYVNIWECDVACGITRALRKMKALGQAD